ncbi:hypothetical protein F4776DRAFT_659838 [Hypoxylon sp. NC0597]|nr:hypothetical protein F4776DRAFT_659838 [Hypoxylon sp. NC0597]
MSIILKNIYRQPDETYNIVARNHSENTMKFSPPNDKHYIACNYKIGERGSCTELNITNAHGCTANIQLEESNSNLIVSGNIESGRKTFKISKPHNFSIELTSDGYLALQCLDGNNWGPRLSNWLSFKIIPFQD